MQAILTEAKIKTHMIKVKNKIFQTHQETNFNLSFNLIRIRNKTKRMNKNKQLSLKELIIHLTILQIGILNLSNKIQSKNRITIHKILLTHISVIKLAAQV